MQDLLYKKQRFDLDCTKNVVIKCNKSFNINLYTWLMKWWTY